MATCMAPRPHGETFQFDWSEEGLVVGGIYYRAQVSHMKLCSSRAFWLVAYPSQGYEMLFDAHTRSFAALGGVARRGIYDLVPGNRIVEDEDDSRAAVSVGNLASVSRRKGRNGSTRLGRPASEIGARRRHPGPAWPGD